MTDKTWEEYKKKKKAPRRVTPMHLLNKQNYVANEIADSRMQLCEQCPELIKMTKQCKKCGCFMALKTKIKFATCPLQKW